MSKACYQDSHHAILNWKSYTHSVKSYMLSLTEYVRELNDNALWDIFNMPLLLSATFASGPFTNHYLGA